MSCKGLPRDVVNFFEFILSNTSVSVYFRGSKSSPWVARQGVRQGGVTSAYLFCIYIDDILNDISNLPDKCKLGISNLNIQAYADDIVVFCPSAGGLRNLMDCLGQKLTAHGLVINLQKTKILIFDKNKKKSASFHFMNEPIGVVYEYKYNLNYL